MRTRRSRKRKMRKRKRMGTRTRRTRKRKRRRRRRGKERGGGGDVCLKEVGLKLCPTPRTAAGRKRRSYCETSDFWGSLIRRNNRRCRCCYWSFPSRCTCWWSVISPVWSWSRWGGRTGPAPSSPLHTNQQSGLAWASRDGAVLLIKTSAPTVTVEQLQLVVDPVVGLLARRLLKQSQETNWGVGAFGFTTWCDQAEVLHVLVH